ncbi:unnamed protein product [Phaedon cochleariae]|uniref:MI domain-containing protein n=1 Tax=Phaedon cochleariae TaxID=80249 RepID=A0A9P0DCW8_PHACE|nr:unnamed protein product [Phaedon cochleariae]
MAYKNKKSKPVKLTRKQQRKEKRNEKKVRRHDYYTNRNKPGAFVLNPEQKNSNYVSDNSVESKGKRRERGPTTSVSGIPGGNNVPNNNKLLTTEQVRKKEQKEQKKLEKEMKDQRKKQLLEANIDEDKVIRQLEKQLGLKKRKSKAVPKSFSEDGLDYLLEVCDSERMKNSINTEQDFMAANDVFEEDFALMSNKQTLMDENDEDNSEDNSLKQSDEEYEQFSDEESNSDYATEDESMEDDNGKNISDSEDGLNSSIESDENVHGKSRKNIKSLESQNERKKDKTVDERQSFKNAQSNKRKLEEQSTSNKKIKTLKIAENEELSGNDDSSSNEQSEDDGDTRADEINDNKKGAVKSFPDGTWEDIYGRKRAKDGSIITKKNESKYIPPAMRVELERGNVEDKKRFEKLNRLKKQLKGLLNRLAERNMHSIATQIEELYMNNSRNDMNDTLTNLIMESLVSEVLTPERLLIEHVVLLTILHANVGTEVGAHFLQHVIRQFDQCLSANEEVENKTLDNIVRIVAQLYNFKLFDSKLIYEMLRKLASKFEEKDVECILHILRNVGFGLRKDDPLALKNLIMELQNQAANVTDEERDNSRVKFMLDILLAIKNNNVTKIPNYDTSYSEHLKKVMKGFIRKGNYVSQLNISIEDLLKADERGRWWVVGSAWTGTEKDNNDKSQDSTKPEGFSSKLLKLAKKQRMNTDVRRNIFCIIMSAEDYMDAFEKIVKLGLKNQLEREIINVILHCCLQEKQYNPYYGHLAQKFCDFDRKYQMTIKYSVWDKLKTLTDHSGSQLSNLAKLLIHLFMEKGLPISTLKIVQFGELDKITLRFMRQILLGILLHPDVESCLSIFSKVSQSDKLKLFRESLRLFIHHFLLSNLKSDKIPEDHKELLESRAKIVERVLISKDFRVT